ncbi:MAG: glycerophosphodiester phosphodiesterase [Anaerolineae bacterium]
MSLKPFHRWYRARPLIFGHRGAREVAPENTLAAFRRAAEVGADGVELDVQCSADGVPVVIHDWTLDRTTDGQGPVSRLAWAQLRALDAGGWFGSAFAGERVPHLEEVLEVVGGELLLNLELKARGLGEGRLERAVAQVVRESGLAERVLVSSFNPWCLWRFRREMPEVSLALLTAPDQVLPLRKGWLRALCRADTLHPHHSLITPTWMKQVRSRGIRVNTWTVNDREMMERLWRWGVGMVCSDVPEHLVKWPT